MKITKSLIPKRDTRPQKKKEKILTSTFESINPENIILKSILKKNSSFKNLKEKIEKESNSNIHEIFSSDESRLKAIKYVINASKGKENQKNYINQQKNHPKLIKNSSFASYDIPVPLKQKNENKIKVKRSQRVLRSKIEQISPIRKDKNKNRFFNDDKPLNEEDMLRDNNMLSNKKEKYIFDSPSSLIPDQFYEITSQREVNLQYIEPKNKLNLKKNSNNNYIYTNNFTQNNLYESQNSFKEINPIINNFNNYKKIKYVKNNNQRDRSPISDYYYQNINTDDNLRNNTINTFYIHKQINKSALYDGNKIKNNINNQYNNHQEKKIIYSNKNSSYDLNNNINDNFYHRKNISHDAYYDYNLQQINNKNQNKIFYATEGNNFYEPNININRINYIKNSSKLKFYENNKKKNIIRITNNNNNQAGKDLSYNNTDNNCTNLNPSQIEIKRPFKRKNNSFFINESIPIKINQYNYKVYNETENNTLTHTNSIINTLNNDFSFHKKVFTNINNNKTEFNNENNTIYNENRENIANNRILVKKRPLKENVNLDTKSGNSKKNKNTFDKLYICLNNSFIYKCQNEKLIIFNNENEIVDYINKKFEEDRKTSADKKLKYSGFILTKKYKGKIISEIRIEDNMDKLNKKIKEENIIVENKLIEIIDIKQKEEYDNIKKNIINLEKEVETLKKENQNISKKDYLKNELIKKLDKEKESIIKENEKLSKELEQIKKINGDINNQLQEISNKNKKENKIKNYIIENILTMVIENSPKIGNIENEKKIEKNEINTIKEANETPKSNNFSNNLSINFNISNSEMVIDSKKINPLSVFGLSKVSEIKIVKNDDNIDSAENELKNSLALLNGKSKSNKGEVSPFNEKDDEEKIIK